MHVMFNFTKVMALNNEVDIFSQTRLENAKLKVWHFQNEMCTEKINLISPSQAFNNLITCNMILWLSSYIIFSQSSVCKKINIRIKKHPLLFYCLKAVVNIRERWFVWSVIAGDYIYLYDQIKKILIRLFRTRQ